MGADLGRWSSTRARLKRAAAAERGRKKSGPNEKLIRELSLLSSVIIYDRLGGTHESGASAGGIGTASLGLVSDHSQRQKETDTRVTRAQDSSVGP